jgi:hypothetical protein
VAVQYDAEARAPANNVTKPTPIPNTLLIDAFMVPPVA